MAYTCDKMVKENCRTTNVTAIGIFDSNGNLKGKIDCAEIVSDAVYSFGLLSDVHCNDGTYSSDYKNNADFQRALQYFAGRSNVKFTCIAGDITQQAKESELQVYKNHVDSYAGGKPVYTTGGNHDRWGKWVGSDFVPYYWGDTSMGGTNPDKWAQYTGMSADMGNGSNAKHQVFSKTYGGITDWFVFFNMDSMQGDTKTSQSSGMSNPYTAEDIAWLTAILEAHKNSRVFIFIHCFFPACAGNYDNHYQTNDGAKIKTDETNWQNLVALRTAYPNTVWFSGHSHWQWQMQGKTGKNASWGKNYNANIYPVNLTGTRDGGYCVHVPSTSEPTWTDSSGNTTKGSQTEDHSQIAIVDVYSNFILIRGMDLSSNTYKYVPLAQYKLTIPYGGESNIVGSVSGNNQITLNNMLSSGTYTLKYIDANELPLGGFEPFDDTITK